MPRPPNPNNPPCESCGSNRVSVNKNLDSGNTQYRCNECKHTWTPNKKPHARAGKGKLKYMDRPLSNAEHQRLWRRKQKLLKKLKPD
jgi:transposase-like protein